MGIDMDDLEGQGFGDPELDALNDMLKKGDGFGDPDLDGLEMEDEEEESKVPIK